MNEVINVLYGTLSGNSESCAELLRDSLSTAGFTAELSSISEVNAEFLSKCKYVFLCISTYGDGDPPDDVWDQWDEMVESQDNDFSNFKYSVLALGDTDYELFCEAGKRFDEAFENQGATRVLDRVDCDVDFEDPSKLWIENVVSYCKTI
jgi:sulfite reductase (NADPH) flavoprotein alpha-component|tara:strand:+ start:1462 stop:1911 length:450 start_codon:yes stop_codon:yes gene_type:complete